MKFVPLLGRLFFSLIFIMASFGHFTKPTIEYAASSGVPYPEFLVPLSGAMALAGGLSILFGFYARFGALLIILFLVPVTIMMHQFWTIADPAAAMMQQAMFMKNLALLGGALIILFFGSGPFSIKKEKWS